jgi:hypothetical protein
MIFVILRNDMQNDRVISFEQELCVSSVGCAFAGNVAGRTKRFGGSNRTLECSQQNLR